MDSDATVDLVPPLTAEQIKENEKFQTEMRNRFALPSTALDRQGYARRVVADCLDILVVLQSQYEATSDDTTRAVIAAKAGQIKLDCCQWMQSLGMFAEAEALCPDEELKKLFLKYRAAENREDSIWCEHPRYKLVENKRQPNFYREFDYFSPQRAGRQTSMTRCAECEMRNAVNTPDDLLELDRQRQTHIDAFNAKQ